MSVNSTEFDVVIIGGGPAGLAASIWCSELGLSNVVLERSKAWGGQLNNIHLPITNFPGVARSSGADLASVMREQALAAGGDLILDAIATDIREGCVALRGGMRFHGGATIFAGGIRRRSLDLPGESEFRSNGGVLRSGAQQAKEVAGSRVVVVGGGDAALENALILAEHAASVALVHHSDNFKARPEFTSAARQKRNIHFFEFRRVAELVGTSKLESVVLEDVRSGEKKVVATDHLLVRIGFQPNTEILQKVVDLDDLGYVRTDDVGMTSVSSIYAVGDAAAHNSPTLASAVGQAATAAKNILRFLRS